MNVTHSTWPVIVIPYNLPPWLCMKQTNFILSLLIPGSKGPSNNIDVYMQPLVEELKELWEVGIKTFDASTNESFQMHAMLLWTINDFPAYANLFGWSTRGKCACPACEYDTYSKWLKNSGKYCYMGHRRWLKPNHKFRNDKKSFDGTQEHRFAPRRPSGTLVLRQLDDIEFEESGWKKKSIFFDLPYWEYNVIRHNFDVMHIDKNVCDNLLGTIMGQEGKTKDNYKARLDLVEMGIRSELHPKDRPSGNGKYLPMACYQMTLQEKDTFLKVLKEIKVPDECSSNISRCVQLKQRKLIGLKSYDCHVLMQEFIPIAIRGSLPDKVCSVIINLCNIFRDICLKVLNEQELKLLQSQVVEILCEMEKIFPPSFFTSMVHLIIHLPEEAKLAGPIMYRWMYPIERFLLTLKSFVRNKAHPEASIAEGYITHECLIFCSSKKHRFNVKQRKRLNRAHLDDKTLKQAHRYILFNCDAVNSYRRQHEASIRRGRSSGRLSRYVIQRIHTAEFANWFHEQVASKLEQENVQIFDEIKWLSRGPSKVVRKYTGYIINGYRFHTKDRERGLKTQNSGVIVTSAIESYASARDTQPSEGKVSYYGVIKDIIQLNYNGKFKFVLFKCDWVDINKGCKKDKFGFTLVNLSQLTHKGDNLLDDPFVLASQVKKVYYIRDERHKNWFVVKHAKLRDTYDMGEQHNQQEVVGVIDDMVEPFNLVRNDVNEDGVDITPTMEKEVVQDIEMDEFRDDIF